MQNKLFYLLFFIIIALTASGCNSQNNKSESLMNEGVQLFQQGKYSDAILKYEGALKQDPNNAVGYNLLGMAYRFRFNQAGAQEFKEKEIEAFKKAITIDPKFWVAYKNLSASLYYQGKKKEAVPYVEKALELQPNDPEKTLLLQWIEEGKKE
jgi:tetratricopeptide (TPR) repeat protein